MLQLNAALEAEHFASYPFEILHTPSVLATRLAYDSAASEICDVRVLKVGITAGKKDSQTFGDYLEAWFSREGTQNLIAQAKLGATKILSRSEIYNFTEQEVCKFLERAIYLMSSGVEDQFLSDRLEPWIGLARPISHNVDTRVYYWPEIEI